MYDIISHYGNRSKSVLIAFGGRGYVMSGEAGPVHAALARHGAPKNQALALVLMMRMLIGDVRLNVGVALEE
jgi:hypothetical protein